MTSKWSFSPSFSGADLETALLGRSYWHICTTLCQEIEVTVVRRSEYDAVIRATAPYRDDGGLSFRLASGKIALVRLQLSAPLGGVWMSVRQRFSGSGSWNHRRGSSRPRRSEER